VVDRESGTEWVKMNAGKICMRAKVTECALAARQTRPRQKVKNILQPKNGCNFVISRGLREQQRKCLRAWIYLHKILSDARNVRHI